MSLAIALCRRGIEVEIAEITPEWSVVGTGISSHRSGAPRALKAIDLLDRCFEEGWGVSAITNCDAHGNVRDVVQVPRLNGPEYPAMAGIVRPTLHGILRTAVEDTGAGVRLGVTVTALEQTPGGVDVRFSDGTSATYGLVGRSRRHPVEGARPGASARASTRDSPPRRSGGRRRSAPARG